MAEAVSTSSRTIEQLVFDNKALRVLPLDPTTENYVRQVPNACFSRVEPTPVASPQLVTLSTSALGLLGLNAAGEAQRADFAEFFSGNKVLPGAEPAAHCYCGHQFGYFSGQLGDGATMYLGEVINPAGERWELQFKGAGKTPYSRTADGRKVLRSSLREFLCSEAMHALGVPTTRAGTIISSASTVARDVFYTGDVKPEPCSVITRIAPSFIRFGSFEVVKGVDPTTGRSGPSPGDAGLLNTLVNYVTETFYPEVAAAHDDTPGRCLGMYREVVRRTATLVAGWQAVGFCHGVLNTDNMSIVGVTIDYGPFGFMDRYDPDFICNASDDGGRYTYARQPEMCKWNCETLGKTLTPAMGGGDWRAVLEEEFDSTFSAEYDRLFTAKLGLTPADDNAALVEALFATMKATGADFTNTFRLLSFVNPAAPPDSDGLVVDFLLQHVASPAEIAEAYKPSVPEDQLRMLVMLAASNPSLASQMAAINAEQAKHRKYKELMAVDASEKAADDRRLWAEWLAQYRARLARDVPAEGGTAWQAGRVQAMNAVNPKYVLRNYMAQRAIEEATTGNFTAVRDLQKLLAAPYTASTALEASVGAGSEEGVNMVVDAKPPAWASELKVT